MSFGSGKFFCNSISNNSYFKTIYKNYAINQEKAITPMKQNVAVIVVALFQLHLTRTQTCMALSQRLPSQVSKHMK